MMMLRANFHRKVRPSPAIARLIAEGFAVEAIDEFKFVVDGRFELWPATSYWRSLDGRIGYTIDALIDALRAVPA